MVWKPNVTVAAIIEKNGRFLLVEEETTEGVRLNQPAGHLEDGESLIEAVIRETREETAHPFVPGHLVGIYRMPVPEKDLTYLRFAFAGEAGREIENQALDHGIIRTVWLTPEELQATPEKWRSPLVWQCVADYLAGRRYPLSILNE